MCVRELVEVPQSFCANKDAVRKMYRYVIHDGRMPDPFLRRYAWFVRQPLDAEAMRRASRCLVGRHDFRCFETEWPNRLTSVRTITHLAVNRVGEFIWIDVEADGFLYNMVRAIAGTLMQVGRGYWPETQVDEVLNAMDRTTGRPDRPARGAVPDARDVPSRMSDVTYSRRTRNHPAGEAAERDRDACRAARASPTGRWCWRRWRAGTRPVRLTGALRSEDTEVMIDCLRRLGFDVEPTGTGRRSPVAREHIETDDASRPSRPTCSSPTPARRCGS